MCLLLGNVGTETRSKQVLPLCEEPYTCTRELWPLTYFILAEILVLVGGAVQYSSGVSRVIALESPYAIHGRFGLLNTFRPSRDPSAGISLTVAFHRRCHSTRLMNTSHEYYTSACRSGETGTFVRYVL